MTTTRDATPPSDPLRPRRLYRPLGPFTPPLFVSFRRPLPPRARTCERGEGDSDAAPKPYYYSSSSSSASPPPPRHPPEGVRAHGFPRDEGLLGVQYAAAGVRGRGVGGGAARHAPLRRRPRRRRILQRRHRSLAVDAAAAARRPGSRGGFSGPGDASRRPLPPQAPPPARRGRRRRRCRLRQRRRRRRRRRRRSTDAPGGRRVRGGGRHRDLPGEGDAAAERGAGVHGGRDEPVRRRRRRRVRHRGDPRAVRVVQLGEPGGPACVPAARPRRLPPQRRPPAPRRRDRLLRVHQLLPLQAFRLRRNLRRRPRRPIAAVNRRKEKVDKTKETKEKQ
uniref:Uncharacterized protein n=1 Tax=Oryza barthii TaxID=65489 RepID=A0A0D3HUD0_9ORYZ